MQSEAKEQAEGLQEEVRELRSANKNLLKAQKELGAAQAALDACSGGKESALKAVESRLASAQQQLAQARCRPLLVRSSNPCSWSTQVLASGFTVAEGGGGAAVCLVWHAEWVQKRERAPAELC